MSWTEGRSGRSFTDKVKAAAIRRFGRRCYICGAVGVPLEFDHVIPWFEGGTDNEDNCAPVCNPCHKTKSNREKDRARKRRQAKATRPAEPHPSEGLTLS